jgi:lycopene beta-cyclase
LQKKYDYIITGAGCAGLSLLMRILNEPALCKKQILVIDAEQKNKNDRTWCFWEKENGLFEYIVHHTWQAFNFISEDYTSTFSIAPYSYKMIHGIEFYNHVLNFAKQFSNVEFRYEKITAVSNNNNKAIVSTVNETYTAAYIFNSVLFNQTFAGANVHTLLQHFKGWLIETKEDCFNAEVATFMDFTVSQKHGTTFMYVLPVAPNKALVEYTLFTEKLLQSNDYNAELKNHIEEKLAINDYTISHEEFGIIPMTNYRFPLHDENIVNIGIAGGQAKGSSGYAFQFIQKRTAAIVQSLITKNHPFVKPSIANKKFSFYDSVLLHVLCNKKMKGSSIFSSIFKKNSPQKVLQFLDNESSLVQDLQIMTSVPMGIFLPAAIKEILK